jgi:hypothetical protein
MAFSPVLSAFQKASSLLSTEAKNKKYKCHLGEGTYSFTQESFPLGSDRTVQNGNDFLSLTF